MDQAILERIANGQRLTTIDFQHMGDASDAERRQIMEAREQAAGTAVFQSLAIKRASKKSTIGERQVEHVASTERPCGMFKDIVRQSAWTFEDFFNTGGPLQWAHDPSIPVIGNVREMRKATVKKEKAIIARSEFLPAGLHSFADLIWELVEGDFIRGVSVGFHIEEWNKELTDDERKEKGIGPWGLDVTRAQLVELSVTQIPADKGAVKLREVEDRVTRAVSGGYLDTELLRALAAGLPELRELESRLDDDTEEEVSERVVMRGNLPDSIEERVRELERSKDELLAEIRRLSDEFQEMQERFADRLQRRGDEGGSDPVSEADLMFDDASVLPSPRELVDDIFQGR